MQNLVRDWNIYQLAKTWQVRPSELMGLVDPFEMFCFDQAIAEVGNTIMGEINAIHAKDQKEQDRKVAAVFKKYFGTSTSSYNAQEFRTITAPTK